MEENDHRLADYIVYDKTRTRPTFDPYMLNHLQFESLNDLAFYFSFLFTKSG